MDSDKVLIYQTPDEETSVDVKMEQDTIWLIQEQMAALYQKELSVIIKHVSNIFKERELAQESNVQNLHIAHSNKPVRHYSLDVIISAGYRVKSQRGIQFQIWASQVLKEYLAKGYALDKRRFKLLQENKLLHEMHSFCSREAALLKVDSTASMPERRFASCFGIRAWCRA